MGFLSSILGAAGPVVGGLIGGPAGGLIGAGLSGASSALAATDAREGVQRQNMMQIAAAREQMEFQRRMSNTAHRREVRDLRKAGLNPILSAKYGGSSTPGGAMPSIANEQAAATAVQLQKERQIAEISLLQAQAEKEAATATNLKANTDYTIEQTRNVELVAEKLVAETDAALQRAGVSAATRNLVNKQIDTETQRALAEAARVGNIDADTVVKKVMARLRSAELVGAQLEAQIDETMYGSLSRLLKRYGIQLRLPERKR